MKKTLNASRTCSHLTRPETPGYNSPNISSHYIMFSHDRQSEQYVPYMAKNVSTAATKHGVSMGPLGLHSVRLHVHESAVSEKMGKDAARSMYSAGVQNEDYNTSCSIPKQECLNYAQVFNFSVMAQHEAPTQQHRIPQRKTRQHLQKECKSATVIQSARRGDQVRWEMEEMNKAAAKIQAAYRGYRTRQELLLGSNTRIKGKGLKQNMENTAKNKYLPAASGYYQQWDWGFQTQDVITKNNRSRCHHKNKHSTVSFVIPTSTFLKTESSVTLDKEELTIGHGLSALKVFKAMTQQQEFNDAATRIQAVWRGYHVRKQMREIEKQAKILVEAIQSFSDECKISPENHKSCWVSGTAAVMETQSLYLKQETTVRKPEPDLDVKPEASMENKYTNTESSAPLFRNINVYTVVKGRPSSQQSLITIRVSSPNALVQGYHRDTSRGTQGLYTVKHHNSSKPSQIFVQINFVEKDVHKTGERE